VQPFDMIPLSDGVESVVALQPGAAAPLRVLYEDAQLLVVDKPPHLPTTPDAAHDSCVLERLQKEHAAPELTALHRLDVGTSGVCLFVKQRSAVQQLSERLRAGEKHYLALVKGATRPKGIVRAALREQGKTRPAVSRYTRVARAGSHSLVRVRPEQGRTHQVRKHMAAIGHPLLGDARYGDAASNRYFEHRHGLDRTFLHAARVRLAATADSPELLFEAPLAPDLRAVQASLRNG
jgi:23S rRNA (uracil1939-C5)-methyltransferase